MIHNPLVKSLSSMKSFFGSNRLSALYEVEQWLGELSQDLHSRLVSDREKHARAPTSLSVQISSQQHSSSRCSKIAIGRSGGAAEDLQEEASKLV